MVPLRADSGPCEGRGEGVGLLLLLLLLVTAVGCAGRGLPLGADGRYHHADPGYSIDPPRFGEGPAWQRISLDKTDLAWRTDDGRSISLSSSCRKTQAKPALLARRLLIGLEREALLGAHPVALRGDPGWAQTVETGEGGERVRIKTVTVVSAGCVFDWVLVAAADARFDESLEAFDAWWTSFVRDGRPGPVADGSES